VLLKVHEGARGDQLWQRSNRKYLFVAMVSCERILV